MSRKSSGWLIFPSALQSMAAAMAAASVSMPRRVLELVGT
jgi:hypothetical protein